MAFSATALIAAVITSLTCGAVYKLSASVSPRVCAGYVKLKTSDQRNWDSRIPSTLHALAITAATAYALGCSDVFQRSRLDKEGESIMLAQSDFTEAALGLSLGYFVADMSIIAMHFPAMGGWEMVGHHIAATLSLWVALTSHQGHFYTLMLLATEITTPFVNLRWCLDTANKRSSSAYLLNGVTLFLSWLMSRILGQLYVGLHMFQHYQEFVLLTRAGRVLIVAVPPILFALNLWWFTKICKGIVKLLTSSGSLSKGQRTRKSPVLHQNGRLHAEVSPAAQGSGKPRDKRPLK